MVEGADARASRLIRWVSQACGAASSAPFLWSCGICPRTVHAHGQQGLPWTPGCSGRTSLRLPCPWKVSQTRSCFARVSSLFTVCPGAFRVSRGDKRTGEKEKVYRAETWRK